MLLILERKALDKIVVEITISFLSDTSCGLNSLTECIHVIKSCRLLMGSLEVMLEICYTVKIQQNKKSSYRTLVVMKVEGKTLLNECMHVAKVYKLLMDRLEVTENLLNTCKKSNI